jgi:hypothetical protein
MLAHLALSLGIGISLLAGPAWSQESIQLKAKGPEGQTNLRYGFGGIFFVDKNLKDEYDRLLFRIRTLKSGLDDDRIGSADTLTQLKEELKDLQTRLDNLQKEIENKKTFVSLGKIHKQTETVTFDPGPERLLVVTAKNVRVEGWNGQQVKCVLEKQVIIPDKDDSTKADEQLNSIRLIHKYGVAPQTVGKVSAEREADEQKYLAGPEASKLTEQERYVHRLVKTKQGDRYQAFQGKKIDAIAIEGLRPDEGNSTITMEISGVYYTVHYNVYDQELQRHASLTIYVPRCEAVALQDCEKGLIVNGFHGDLLVDGGKVESRGNATFQIHDLYGSLTISDLPINSLSLSFSLSAIHGSVRFLPPLTDGCTWNGLSAPYMAGLIGVGRLMASRSKSLITCKEVEGDFTASFLQADLHLDGVAGKIDVRNDFGDTSLTAETALSKTKHRLVSESGRIEARFTSNGIGSLPIQALTICGSVSADVPYSVIEDQPQEATWPAADGSACTWRGMISRRPDKIAEKDLVARCKFMRAIVNGEDDYPCVDLLSRSGVIRILYEPKEKLKAEEN